MLHTRLAGLTLLALASTLLPYSQADGTAQTTRSSEPGHPYFDRLLARSDLHTSYSLRDHDQLVQWAHGAPLDLRKFPPPQYWVDYTYPDDPDPRRQDAAKVIVPADRSGSKQVRMPIGITSGVALITWDAWWGAEFQTDRGTLETHKEFQITPHDPEDRGFEIRSRFVLARAPDIAEIDGRTYAPILDNTIDDQPLDPQEATFVIAAETWTRYWALVELGAPTRLSLWVADETREAVQLFDGLAVDWMNADGPQQDLGVGAFWIEYNSSQNRRGRELVGYVRNLVALHNPDTLADLFERPAR